MPLLYNPTVHAQLARTSWDAIVIGSGLGGLTAASLLARRNKRVLVLERHSVPGGFTHTFKRRGFEWDVGVHYVGQVSHPAAPIRRMFDFVTDGAVQWADLGPSYDRALIAGSAFDFLAGRENLLRALIERFPAEERAIRRYFRLVRSVSSAGAWFFGEKTMPPLLSATLGRLLRWRFERMARRTTLEVLRSLTLNAELIAALCAQCGDYGLSPARSSFGIHAVVVAHYWEGASYPVGGSRRIPEALIAGIERRGGSIVVKAEVDQLRIANGRVTGVRMKDGQALAAPVVISNAGVLNTFGRLFPADTPVPARIARGLPELEPSTAHVCLYVGLRGSDAELGLPRHNIWIYDDPELDERRADRRMREELLPSMAYLSFPSAKDPEWTREHPGRATVQIISACPYDLFKPWEGRPWGRRGDDYLALKARLRDRLLERLYGQFPQLRGRVEHAELSTPLSTRHFANYGRGEIYGVAHTPRRFRQRWLRPQTPIKGLFLTGQDIVTVGVGGALFSGMLTASRVLNRPLLWEAFRGR